jgi:hypothetical protein
MGRGLRPLFLRFSNCAALASLEKLSLNYSRCGVYAASFPSVNVSRPAGSSRGAELTGGKGPSPDVTRATVNPTTEAAPVRFKAREQASSVAPVVITSSTSKTRSLSTRSAFRVAYARRTDSQCSFRESSRRADAVWCASADTILGGDTAPATVPTPEHRARIRGTHRRYNRYVTYTKYLVARGQASGHAASHGSFQSGEKIQGG